MVWADWWTDAREHIKRGEKQIWCPECGQYIWTEFWTKRKAK